MKKLLAGPVFSWSFLSLAQTSVTSPIVSLELPLADLLDHLNVRAWHFGVTTLPDSTSNVELIYHQRNSEGNFDPDLQTRLVQNAVVPYNDIGPQIVSIMMSPDTNGTKVTIKLNDSTSYQSVVPVDLLALETGFGSGNGAYVNPNSKGEYILLAHYEASETDGVTSTEATSSVDDMASYVSLEIRVE